MSTPEHGTSPPSESPSETQPRTAEHHRRRLRLALTQARQDAGFTQKMTASELDWSISKVVRIEQGTVPVAPSDVRVLLALYGVTDQTEVQGLVELAREARDTPGWGKYDFLSPAFREMLGQETTATHIYKYDPFVVPGYFQTAEYTLDLLAALGYEPKQIKQRAEVRRIRQQIIAELGSPPEMHVVIGEAALIRPVGGPAEMRDQIKRLLEAGDQPNVHLHLLPFSAGAHRGMGSAFTLLQFADVADSLYLEDAEKATTAKEEPEKIAEYLDTYNEIEKLASRSGTFRQQATEILDRLYPSRN